MTIKNTSINILATKRGLRRISILYIMAGGGNTVTKDEEKNKVLNDFFSSVFNNQTPCSPGTQQLEMEYRECKQNETPHNPKGNHE